MRIYPPATSSKPTEEQHSNTYADNLSPSSTPVASIEFYDTRKENPHRNLQTALTETTQPAEGAKLENIDLLKSNTNLERQLHEYQTSNRALQADLEKLQKHKKNCEKATSKAKREAQAAKGNADHLISSQKGQVKNAERRYETAAKELNEWKQRYGERVEGPAEERSMLLRTVAEWKSTAEKAQNEAVKLKGALNGRSESSGASEAESSVKVEGEDPSGKPTEQDASTMKPGRNPSSQEYYLITAIADAKAKAAKYKAERDALHRLLKEEMTRNAKMAESLVLRNARLAESLEGLATDDEKS